MNRLVLRLFCYLLPFISLAVCAQQLAGSWQGALTSPQQPTVSYPTTISFQQTGSQLMGTVRMQSAGVTETYSIKGNVQGNQATGTATYPKDGTTFQFEGMLTNGQLVIAFGLNNVAVMTGTLTRPGTLETSKTENVPSRSVPADKLARDARLAGTWATTSYYGSGTQFYSSTRTMIVFFPDGRIGSGGASVNASYSGDAGSVNGGSSGSGVQMAEGAAWYTKGDQIWVHATRGKEPDQLLGRYSLSDNSQQMLLYQGNGKKIYERVK
ncbi:hypothetical protein [Fibrella arboris]|uniref:hypothetical protein n=1 Tax=Fibrella arboris TaxID=3242486 RepID=UPI00351FC316